MISPFLLSLQSITYSLEFMQPSIVSALLLFFSGTAALVYQTLWVKQLTLVVGVDVYAIAIGISAFFAGLAIGSLMLGRWADCLEQPFRLYAWLELGIASCSIGTTITLPHTARTFVVLQDEIGLLAWILPFLLVGIPATLMGGTLVVLLRASQPLANAVGQTSGILYAANTAGAILGTLATPFLLIPTLGMQATAWVAGLMNLTLAVTAFFACQDRGESRHPPLPQPQFTYAPLALAIYTIAGGLALGYEVIWTQAIVQFLSTRTYAFATVLATYLFGLTLGSWLYAHWADRVKRPWRMFGILLAAAGVSAMAIVAGLDIWLLQVQHLFEQVALQVTHSRMAMKLSSFMVPAVIFVFLPTLLLGAAFPLAIRLAVGVDRIGRDAGRVMALNTVGGIAGTCLTGFVLIPLLGLVRSLTVLASMAVGLGAIALVRDAKRPIAMVVAGCAAIGFAFFAALVPTDQFAYLLLAQHRGQLRFYAESAGGTVAVIEQAAVNTTFHRLYIQGISNTGDTMPSLRCMRLQALLPLLIHQGEPRSVMVIGLGTGITSGALLTYPNLEQRVAVELLPAVVRASSQFEGNFDVVNDRRMTVRIADGRHELLRTREQFDLITLEPPPPSATGVVNLYSRDFYELCRDKLTTNGLLAQWLPLATQNDEDSRSLVRSVLDVFPHVSLWTTELHEMLLVGSMQPIKLNAETITTRYHYPAVEVALSEVGIASPAALLATYVTDRAGLEQYAGDAPAVTDDQPRIEYADWLRPNEFLRVLPKVMATNAELPVVGDAAFLSAIANERKRLWQFYKAELLAYQGERYQWSRLVDQVLQGDIDNPYYRWFTRNLELAQR